eukprot:TRINITY_DN65668_c0_g1_i1.p1 TRINITY_DN65668_c0_g1~~TRINITY_DN65668_c0_g1_i1.p1  ORF type:complete len:116 (-),score=26.23 TRINITY_DN65668_c0_g1_i1:115-462(-)
MVGSIDPRLLVSDKRYLAQFSCAETARTARLKGSRAIVQTKAQLLGQLLEYEATQSGAPLFSCHLEASLLATQLEALLNSSPNPRPVSYTHLRAHETPEHLVCRLLLEKKKPTEL